MKIRFALFNLSLFLVSLAYSQQRYDILLNMVHHNPGEPQFSTHFAEPAYLQQLDYTGQVPKMEIQCGLTYDAWQENIIPLRSEERFWIERHAADVRVQLKKAKDANIEVYPFTDILVIPKIIMNKYGKEMKDEKGQLTILRPRTQEIVKAQIDELFKRFPNLDGLTFRHGETYLHDTPYHVGGSPARTPDEHAKLINILREEICVKRNKKLFYRTWDFEKLHTKPDLYMAAMNQVVPHPNLYIMIKHVNYDFNRGYPFNTTIGLGNLQQIIEISVNQAGCYGKNAHPYYIGKGVIDGWNEMSEKERKGIRDLQGVPNVRGFWIWTWGDGWYGPYFDNELWVKLNEFVLRTFVQAPSRSEEDIFFEYATNNLRLSQTDAQKMRKLCLLSEDAVFYGQDTKSIKTNVWWLRDQYLTGIDLRESVKRGLQEVLLKEKAENLYRWYEMEKLAYEIKLPNCEDQEFLEVSTTYGRIKYELVNIIWQVQIMLAELELNGTPIDKSKARKIVNAYNAKWNEWTDLKKNHACCPTLYEDWRAVHINNPFQESLKKLESLCQ